VCPETAKLDGATSHAERLQAAQTLQGLRGLWWVCASGVGADVLAAITSG